MPNYEYVGCFLDYKELLEKVRELRYNSLPNEKVNPHVTFEYHPASVDTCLFGEKIFVAILGYGNNGENEGLQVTLSCGNKQLSDMIKKIDRPHITLAVSSSGQAVNTKYLEFKPVDPVYIVGCYDGHIED